MYNAGDDLACDGVDALEKALIDSYAAVKRQKGAPESAADQRLVAEIKQV